MTITDLAKGHKSFKALYFKKHEKEFLNLVKEGQNPKALFIGCSDSRVIPSLIIDAKPGDLFVVRNIGNFVPPFKPDNDFHGTAAAIEYAVSVLNVSDIIVCGHSHCGACAQLYVSIDGDVELVHTKKWLELGQRAKEEALACREWTTHEELLILTEKISIVHQLENLLTYPGVRRRVDAEELYIHGWYYKLETGEIEYFNPEKQEFLPIDEVLR